MSDTPKPTTTTKTKPTAAAPKPAMRVVGLATPAQGGWGVVEYDLDADGKVHIVDRHHCETRADALERLKLVVARAFLLPTARGAL